MVSAYVAADHAVAQLIAQVGTRKGAEQVQRAADMVSQEERLIRAAQSSMMLRLRQHHPVEDAFRQVHDAFVATYTALGPAVGALGDGVWNEQADISVHDALELRERFAAAFDAAMDLARGMVGHAA